MPNPHTLGNNHRIQMAFVPAEVLDCLKLTFGQFFEDIANMNSLPFERHFLFLIYAQSTHIGNNHKIQIASSSSRSVRLWK